MTIGFLGAPRRPIVEAIGMPVSMCVAWMSPLDSESRIAAQLAPFTIVELIPYFLKNPFSCAITIGELSVSAMIPRRTSVTSGPPVPGTFSPEPALGAAGDPEEASEFLHPGSAAATAAPVRPLRRFLRSIWCFMMTAPINWTLPSCSESEGQIELHDLVLAILHRLVERHGERDAGPEPRRFTQLDVKAGTDRPGGGVAQVVVGLDRSGRGEPALMANFGADGELGNDEVAGVKTGGEVGVGVLERVRSPR